MLYSKRHYKNIACTLAYLKRMEHIKQYYTVDEIIKILSDTFTVDNDNFKPEQFKKFIEKETLRDK